MTYRDGAGTGTFPAFRYTAGAVVSAYAVLAMSPLDGDEIPSTGVTLTVNVANSAGGNSDVHFDVASDSAFVTVVWSTTQTNKPNGLLSVLATGLTSGTKYWWRARLAPTGTTTWGPYSETRAFTPDLNAGRAIEYVSMNYGAEYVLDPDPTAVVYVDENAGFEAVLDHDPTAVVYVDDNVGVLVTRLGHAVQSVEEGDVSTNTPTPHLWFLKPNGGRAGDGISIYCFGVGDLSSTYAGIVQVDYGPVTGWVNVSVTGWQTFPPTGNAYTADREISPSAGIIDPQHTVVDVVIPSTALPPGYPLRIRTNGP